MNVDAVLQRFLLAYKVADLPTLALCLKMHEKTFKVWRSRQSVPSRVLVQAASDTGKSVAWLSDGNASNQDLIAAETTPKFFSEKVKQVNLTMEELALLENYRAASAEGRLAIASTSATLAQSATAKKKAA